ncbi:hypothetical protein [Lignipirellula cremea]|uniref:Uncharacterized protein n=1 Tax=Lignipirellula cremea TaxID=2528010 RepID=A0A518DR78_9BACT|nr:hypothetical protein [Lignipirellula cremea]QDU94350.1 hypothetical protein Pla8534_21390 [Lignipirellula cremea]
MNKPEKTAAKTVKLPGKPAAGTSLGGKIAYWLFLFPLLCLLWPFRTGLRLLYRNFLSYIFGRVLRDSDRIYSIKFVYYGDSVYLHPMIWGSAAMGFLQQAGWVAPNWLLLVWFILLVVCYVTIMYNFDVVRTAILGVSILALMGGAYFSTIQFTLNPLRALASHIGSLNAEVSPGFYFASAYVFGGLIISDVLWSWLFRRVEIDESYVYEHQFLRTSTREPIFARGLRRETKDLLEMLLLGAGDIQHRTRNGVRRFNNVPFASLWLGTAIDAMLDHRRSGQIKLERKSRQDDADQATVDHAFPDDDHELDDDHDDGDDWTDLPDDDDSL